MAASSIGYDSNRSFLSPEERPQGGCGGMPPNDYAINKVGIGERIIQLLKSVLG